ncbi:MAG: TraR/DksA family transcriptional regulator [Desulfococcaceae bacterium]|jgi:DnaK suppressor protein|nr:TraR/DksA family transcriptional regulator [Desulfococcaceae bacterium]
MMNGRNFQCHENRESETYMNEKQLRYFQEKLMQIRLQCREQLRSTRSEMQQGDTGESDIADRSDRQTWKESLFHNYTHWHEIFKKSEAALKRIEEGTFGYCVLTGSEIGLQRLKVIPYAHLSVEAQELMEKSVRYQNYN